MIPIQLLASFSFSFFFFSILLRHIRAIIRTANSAFTKVIRFHWSPSSKYFTVKATHDLPNYTFATSICFSVCLFPLFITNVTTDPFDQVDLNNCRAWHLLRNDAEVMIHDLQYVFTLSLFIFFRVQCFFLSFFHKISFGICLAGTTHRNCFGSGLPDCFLINTDLKALLFLSLLLDVCGIFYARWFFSFALFCESPREFLGIVTFEYHYCFIIPYALVVELMFNL